MRRTLTLSALLALAALPLAAQEAANSLGGTGALVAADGGQLGNVSVEVTPSGAVLVTVNAEGFSEGVHGVHLHMVGDCSGEGFESAGDHIADGQEHGIRAEGGPHPGDLPNVTVPSDGLLAMDAFATGLAAETLYDEDGSALVVHANADDYATQPGGGSGDRIACAELVAADEAAVEEETSE